ncbi:MAG TPA: hypothetical protein DEA90_09710 [Opitutae bacterium]|nr:hypothetical protein [Puniceicoccaceae bacterium]HBR94426.1 hypothetical protein [Opitutae bacterium]|tara:strand:- start:1681 stop:2571 length:891 start_codon:yes stop_codon:yes gene_type:complete
MLIEWINDRYQWWWPYAGVAFLCSLLAGVIYFSWPSTPTFEHAEISSNTYGTMEELTQLSNFRSAYLKANGGEASIREILSIRNAGVMISKGKEMPFFSIKRQPDKSLTTFKMREYELTFGVNGPVVWQRVKKEGETPKYELKTGPEGQSLAQMGKFFDSTMSVLLLNQGKIEHLSPSQWQGTETLKVNFAPDEFNRQATSYFDIRTMHQLARIEQLPDGRIRKTLYNDYRDVAGMQEPFKVETYIDEVLQNQIIIEKCEANIGAILSLFDYPEQLADSTQEAEINVNYKLPQQTH